MKNILFYIITPLFYFSSFAQDCSDIYLNPSTVVYDCLPIVEFNLEGTIPDGVSVEWYSNQNAGITIIPDNENNSSANIKITRAGTYQISMKVTRQDGSICEKTFEKEVTRLTEITTNNKPSYLLCNNDEAINIPISVLNADAFQTIRWIATDNLYNGSNIDLELNQVGSHDVIIQTIDNQGCRVQKRINLELSEGPNSDNVIGRLTPSIQNLDCLEIGSTHNVTTEIAAPILPSSISWLQKNENTSIDHNFDITVRNNDIFSYPVEVDFGEECRVRIDLKHEYSVEYSPKFSNPYNGSSLCKKETITLENTTANKSDISNFSWNIEGANIVSETSDKITFYYTQGGTYKWQLNYDGACPSSISEDVTVNIANSDENTFARIGSEDISLCSLPHNLSLERIGEAIPNQGTLFYDWSILKGNSEIANSTSKVFEYEIQNPGKYQVVLGLKDNNLECPGQDTINIWIDDLSLDLNIEDISECSGYTFKPMDSIANPLDESVEYNWEILTNNLILKNSTEKNPSFDMNLPGVFDISLHLSSTINSNCQKSIVKNNLITIIENPELELSKTSVESCTFPTQVDIDDVSDFTGDYSWSLSKGMDTIQTGNDTTFSYAFNQTGAYVLNWENRTYVNNTLCATNNNTTINLDSVKIMLNEDEKFISYCKPFSFKPSKIYETPNFNGGLSFEWKLFDAVNNTYQTINSLDGDITIEDEGIYDLQLTVSSEDSNCYDEVILEDLVEVYDYNLDIGLENSNNCFSETTPKIEKVFYANFDGPQSLFEKGVWSISPDDGVEFLSMKHDSLKISLSKAGKYTVNYFLPDENSNCLFNKKISFGVGAIAEIEDATICLGKTFDLKTKPDIAIGSHTQFAWSSTDEGLNILNPSSNPTKISADKAGSYTVEVTVQNNLGCSVTESKTINAYEIEALFSSHNSGEQCKPTVAEFESLNNLYINSYKWNVYGASNGEQSLFTQEGQKTEILLGDTGSYNIELITESIHGCKDTAKIDNYIKIISPMPHFVIMDSVVSCDTLYLSLLDSSQFIDRYVMDYGSNSQQNYVLNDTNKVFYTYPKGETQPYVQYEINLTTEYKFCSYSIQKKIQVNRPESPPAPKINYVTVESDKVIVNWSTENFDQDFKSIELYHFSDDNTRDLIHTSNQSTPNYFSHETAIDQVNNYTAIQLDNCNLNSDFSEVHSTILLNTFSTSFETIDLTWSPYRGWNEVESYSIYRSIDRGAFEFITKVPGNQRSYRDNYLCNVAHRYYIIANHSEEPEYKSKSNTSQTSPMFVDFREPIFLTSVSSQLDSSIIVNWNTPSFYTSSSSTYAIDRWDNYFGWIKNYAESSESPFVDKKLNTHNTNYKYRVKYTDKCGNIGPHSNYGENIILSGTQYKSHFEMSWNNYKEWSDGIGGYEVLYYNMSSGQFDEVATVLDTNYIDDRLAKEGIDTSYCFRITAFNALDASLKSNSNMLCFVPEPKNYFPNAFTPNKDGVNETFKFKGKFAKNLNAKIFNRWGHLVYESNEVEFEWDGTHQNTKVDCAVGSYVFQYQLTGFDGTVIKENKTIFLIR